MERNIHFVLFIIILASSSCGNVGGEKKKSECPIPIPQAIFTKKMDAIKSQSFSLKGRDSEEVVQFTNGDAVTIYQSGCDKIAQEYRFRITPPSNENVVELATEKMMQLANLDDEYMSFANWAQAIGALRNEFAKNNTVEVEKGFFVALDKLDSKEHTTLIIRLFQQ